VFCELFCIRCTASTEWAVVLLVGSCEKSSTQFYADTILKTWQRRAEKLPLWWQPLLRGGASAHTGASTQGQLRTFWGDADGENAGALMGAVGALHDECGVPGSHRAHRHQVLEHVCRPATREAL